MQPKIELLSHDLVARIPQPRARTALESVPRHFYLYNRAGEAVVEYGGAAVPFDPGSSGVRILDPDTLEHRPAQSSDLVPLVKVAEMLPQYAAQSTAVVCHDAPKEIGDLYRLYIVLLHSAKPIVTGAFSTHTTQVMFDMLAIFAGGRRGSPRHLAGCGGAARRRVPERDRHPPAGPARLARCLGRRPGDLRH